MKLDIEKYLVHMQDMNLTLEQKRELLITLYGFVENCVDRAFGKDATQLVLQERQLRDDKHQKTIVDSKDNQRKDRP